MSDPLTLPRWGQTYTRFAARVAEAVEAHKATLRTSERSIIVAWVTRGGRLSVAAEFPKWRNGFDGWTAVTSIARTSPTEAVVRRIIDDFGAALTEKQWEEIGYQRRAF